ncbi:MAG: DUF192 domain-containing protein [bacterium]
MFKNKIFWSVVAVAVILIAVSFLPKPEYEFASVAFMKNGELVQVYIPTNEKASTLGLGKRSVLPEDYGMLWRFEPGFKPSFVMKGMRFPLDFIWIDQGKVVEVTENVVPSSTAKIVPTNGVTEVLEVNAGYVKRHNVLIGDEVEIQKNW